MITRWTLLLLSAWILFAAPVAPAAPASPAIVCSQTQQVEYAPAIANVRTRQEPLRLLTLAPARPPYQPAPSNRPPPPSR